MSDDSAGNQQNVSSDDKDRWDKFDILFKPIAAFLTAAIIWILGYFGNSALRTISAHEQNARLYTELLSRREEAESSLRKDMFKEVMSGFFSNVDDRDIENSLSKKLLKLEILSLNFGDSLSLGPLFKEMSADIVRSVQKSKVPVEHPEVLVSKDQERLRSLARRVATAQLTTIYAHGKNIPFPTDIPVAEIPSDDDTSGGYYVVNDTSTINVDNMSDHAVELDGVKRVFELYLKNANLNDRSVQVELHVYSVGLNNELGEEVGKMPFTLDYFNFPLVDNTLLSDNQRFALVLQKFDKNSIKLAGVIFPGIYANQRDQPSLDEAIKELKEQQPN